MNPYTTMTRARIQPHDMANTLFTDSFTAAAALAGLERQREWHADADLARLLKQHGVPPTSAASLVTMVRQSLGASLVRVGARLVGTATTRKSPTPAPVSTMLRMAD